MDLITHTLTANYSPYGIRSLIPFSTPGWGHHEFSALPPQACVNASPKAISGRTSYLRVRLEFLRQPQVIRQLFNGGRFGPPQSFTSASTCPWLDHPVSGLLLATYIRPVKTRFRFGFAFSCLTLHPKAARRFILQKARHHPLTGSDFLQAYGFRFSFTPLARFFSPFPHGTSSLSLTLTYSALADGPACFRQDFTCPVVLRIPLTTPLAFQYRDFTFCVRAFHHVPVHSRFVYCGPTTPYRYGLG